MLFYCLGIIPVNIENLLLYLPGTTQFGIGIAITSNLVFSTISIIIFGYYSEKILERFSIKSLFIITNLIWVISFGLIALSGDYNVYLIFTIIAAIGHGAFGPIAFSMISDFFLPDERGDKYGFMQFGSILGTGMGLIFGGLLGTYAGPNGWRFAYGLGALFGFLALLRYFLVAIAPERGRAEPEFNGFEGQINYNYKITFKDLIQLFKKKTIASILIANIFCGVAMSTLSYWGIYYLTLKLNIADAGFYATTLFLLAGIGNLPGTIIGGRIGDSSLKSGKIRGRISLSFSSLIMGILCLMAFYLVPFYMNNLGEIIFSVIFFLIIGFLGFFLTSLRVGNISSIYSEICAPESRSIANALSGLTFNVGGIIGNLILSSMIENDLSILSDAVLLVFIIWLFGSFLWIFAYIHYPKESRECRELLLQRKEELEKKN